MKPNSRVLPSPIAFGLGLNVALALIWMLFLLWSKKRGLSVHSNLPYPFARPWFHDFLVFRQRFRLIHSASFFSSLLPGEPFEYPATSALVYLLFYTIPFGLQFFLLLIVLAGILPAIALARAMIRRGVDPQVAAIFVGVALLTSYPFWFEMFTGNIEVVVFLLLMGGIFALLGNRPYLAAMLFGVITAMKIFPAVFFGLLLAQRRYRAILVGGIAAFIANLFALWVICPNILIASQGIQQGLRVNRMGYILPFRVLYTPLDHSLIGFAKRVLHEFGLDRLSGRTVAIYLLCTASIGLILYFLRIRKLPIINQIVVYCVVAVLLPPTSHDYTLLHLYGAWSLCVLYAIRLADWGRVSGSLTAAFVCFAIVFSPEYELIYHGISCAAQVKCIALLILLTLALANSWDTPRTATGKTWSL